MYTQYEGVAIRAIAAAAPTHVLDNEQYAATVEDKRYRRRILYTGIKQRHMVVGRQRTSDLASIAAEAVMKKRGWDPASVGVLLFITQNPDMYAPSTAMLIQSKLKMSQNLMAFDINLGCSGFTTGVQVLASILKSTKGRGLLLMGDCQHYAPGTEYSADSILFGDGGAAVAMEHDPDAEPLLCDQYTDGSRFKALCATYDQGHIMDGNEIVLFSLNEVVDSINAFHQHYDVCRDDVDFYALHQAQKIIVDGIANNCQLPVEKVLSIYQTYGNTSSASIPFALCGNTDKYPAKKLQIFGSGFGIGLAWSSVLFSIDSDCILPMIESDYAYPNLF